MTSPDNLLLSVNNLGIQFANHGKVLKAVDDISFTIRKGEFLALVGESGSGKSLSALAIPRLLPLPEAIWASGQVLWHGADSAAPVELSSLPEKSLRSYRGKEIAMIFQEPMTSLNPLLTCGTQVAEAIRLHKQADAPQAKAETLALFERVMLPDPERIYRSYPHQLSGGQKQRVMIAMAVSCHPALLIADEPTTALDVTVQQSIMALLKSLQEEIGAAILFISHDLRLVGKQADRVLVMKSGKIVEQGIAQEVFTHPVHPYTQGLLACRPPLDTKLLRLPTISDYENTQKETSASSPSTAVVISNAAIEQRMAMLDQQSKLLEVRNLKVWYPSSRSVWQKPTAWVKAVDDVSFSVREGETLGLVGESGSGKSTLARAILALQDITAGEILFDGQPISSRNRKAMKTLRQEMQIVFQDPYSSLNPSMTIGQAIMEPLMVHGIMDNKKQRKEYTLDLLDTVGLQPSHFDRYPREFSGGQRQRIGIARALALQPRFLICDESVSALDVSVQAQILNLLCDLREKRKLTYIFISHDWAVVKFMSDRIMVMQNGQQKEIGDAETIYHNPSSPYTQQLINAIPR